jgi:hypothetical protein
MLIMYDICQVCKKILTYYLIRRNLGASNEGSRKVA